MYNSVCVGGGREGEGGGRAGKGGRGSNCIVNHYYLSNIP